MSGHMNKQETSNNGLHPITHTSKPDCMTRWHDHGCLIKNIILFQKWCNDYQFYAIPVKAYLPNPLDDRSCLWSAILHFIKFNFKLKFLHYIFSKEWLKTNNKLIIHYFYRKSGSTNVQVPVTALLLPILNILHIVLNTRCSCRELIV